MVDKQYYKDYMVGPGFLFLLMGMFIFYSELQTNDQNLTILIQNNPLVLTFFVAPLSLIFFI